MTSPPQVVAVVLNWNRRELTDRAVAALMRQTVRPRIVVVDNGSIDDSIGWLRARHPAIELVPLDTNRGFAGGMNAGIRHACSTGAEWIWLLNNDAVCDEDALAELLRTGQSDPALGAVGSVLAPLGGDGPPVRGATIRWWLGLSQHLRGSGRPPDYLIGASVLLRRSAVDDIGLLDEGFFLYWEDADYCLRLGGAGWRFGISEGSVVGHDPAGTLGSSMWEPYLAYASVRFFRLHSPVPLVPIVCGTLLRVVQCVLAGAPRVAWRVLNATAAALAGRRIAPPRPPGASSGRTPGATARLARP